MPVQCPKCKATFDVSHLEPGSVFVCGECQTQLRAPGAPSGGAPKKPARPATPGRAGAPQARDPRRAGSAAPSSGRASRSATSARGAGTSRRGGGSARPERPGRRSSRAQRETKSGPPMGLILGGVGLLLILVVVAVIAFSGGGDEPMPNGNGQDVAGNGGSGEPEVSVADRLRELDRMYLRNNSVANYREVWEKAKTLPNNAGKSLADKAANQALTIDESLAWAHEWHGRQEFDDSDLPDDVDVMYPDENWRAILEYMDRKWLSPDEIKEAEAAKTAFLVHYERIRNDTHYKNVWHWRTLVSKHAVFKDYKYITVEEGPYLLFIEDPDDPNKLAALKKKAERSAKIFAHLYKVFLDTFQEPFGLPELESDDENDVILKAWLFASRESFDHYQNTIRNPLPPGVAAYYSPATQWMLVPDRGGDPTGEGFNTGVYFHEGTHQLIHQYSKWLLEKETGEELNWTDPRLDSEAQWWQEGIAELFGNVKKVGDSWELFQFSKNRSAFWKMIRNGKRDEWNLKDLLSATGNADVMRRRGYWANLFYCQGWAFTYFLWHYEDGKYRDEFMEYTKREFYGDSGPKVFKEVFGVGIDEIQDSQMGKEFFKYAEELLEKAPNMQGG